MSVRIVIAAAVSLAVLSGPAHPQGNDETLADIRQQLSALFVEVQRLKRELSTTGGAAQPVAGGTVLQRLDAIEAQMTRLTARSEQLENRINTVVADGTNRIGDLEFRLCELEAGCDIASLGETSTLGGDIAALPPVTATEGGDSVAGPELAVGEQADFDRALGHLENGDAQAAVRAFEAFIETYPVGALTIEAHFHRGVALKALGQRSDSARAFLESFSGDPAGPRAAEALFNLGLALSDFGQQGEACVTLGEVQARFPGSVTAGDAGAAIQAIGCS